MTNKSVLLSVLMASLLVACGGGGGSPSVPNPPDTGVTPPAPDPTGLLVTSSEGEGLTEYSAKLSRESTARNAFGAPVAVEAAPAADAGGGSFSGTYTLESGVDEHDIVKYDGATLAIAPSRSGCCFVVDAFPLEADAAMEEPAPLESQIRLFATDPVAGTASQSGAITLPESISAEGLYLDGSSLQALLSTSWWAPSASRLSIPFTGKTSR